MKDFTTFVNSHTIGKSNNSQITKGRPKSVWSDENVAQETSSLPSRMTSKYPAVVGVKTKTADLFYKPSLQPLKVGFESMPSIKK